MEHEFRTHTFKLQTDERELAALMGIDYEEVLRYREERANLPTEVQDALDEVQRETMRRMLGI